MGDFEDIEPGEFYDLACELENVKRDLNSTESSINRNVYGRIYYSVFLFLREWLKKNTDYDSRPSGEHTKLPNYIRFRGPFDKGLNEVIFRNLILLKKLRHQADYKLVVPPKSSKEYQNWNLTSIDSAFIIAEDIINTFVNFKS